jgi:hypothetical protein
MARTSFTPTIDGETALYPEAGSGIQSASTEVSGHNRYDAAGLVPGTGVWQFPIENDAFNVPFLQFKFLDAFGNLFNNQRAPTIYLRMPNQFNISGFSEYARTDNVFGAGNQLLQNENALALGKAKQEEGFDSSLIAKYGLSASEAFQTGIARALAGVEGFLASGGMNNISQFEFTQRQAINPFAQLLYKGPQHRKYQIPVIMRPRTKQEADNIKKIIHTFRVASSPSVPNVNGNLRYTTISRGANTIPTGIGEGSTFTFGYPHLTQFDVIFKTVEQDIKVFRSKPCVIDSVSVDYGGQKLTFFEDGNVTEAQLTIQLTEIIPRTLGDGMSEAKNTNFSMI